MAATKVNVKVLANFTRRQFSLLCINSWKEYFHKNNYSSFTNGYFDKDPAPYFLNPDVQKLLRVLTRPVLDKVFKQRKDGIWLEPPKYKFMTEEELKQTREEALAKVDIRLHMPPVIRVREDKVRVLQKEPLLKKLSDSKCVFTDISLNVNNRERIIVVREPDGTLRTANADERFRMNQIYFPLKGRELNSPPMFQNEYLKPILDRGDYEYVLDRACNQYEPDDPEYHRITSTTYDHVNEHQQFEVLRSTRHFGPLVFYLAWNRNIDNLLLELIQTEKVEETTPLIKLLHILHPDLKSVSIEYKGDDLAYLKEYVELDSLKKSALQLAISSLEEFSKEIKEVAEGIQKAHGQT